MAEHKLGLRHRLAKVRWRWKAAAALHGLLLFAAEALLLFLVLLLADAVYSFAPQVRIGLLAAAALLLAASFVRRVVRPMLRRVSDEQIALYVEERSPQAEGAVISALECERQAALAASAAGGASGTAASTQPWHEGLSRLIAALLRDDAVRRMDRTDRRVFANPARFRKRLLLACLPLAVLALSSLSFPEQVRCARIRIVAPWESLLAAEKEAFRAAQAELARLRYECRRIGFEVQPQGLAILRGKGVEFTVALSHEPAAAPFFHYQLAAPGSKDQAIEMHPHQARFTYRLPFPDINESFTYYVSAARQTSSKYELKVYDPLAVRNIELTYHYPDYLQRDPLTTSGSSGDVTAVADTRIDVRVIANNPLKSGTLRFDGKPDQRPMTCGAKPEDGAKGSFVVTKDSSYNYEIADVYGGTCKLQDFFLVKAVPDNPPSITMVSPKVDMSVHPLCEVTFAAKVADDFAIKDATVRLTYYRDGKPEPMALPMLPAGQRDFRNFLEGRVEHVLELEKLTPSPKLGDMMFYYLEITDRKGQTAKTDPFFIKLMPLEVVAAWPENPTPPDLPHWDYLWTPDIILLAAAAWHIEQQRGKLPNGEFQTQCTQLAGRMEPAMNSQNGLNLLGGKAKLPPEVVRAHADLLAEAAGKLQKALQLVREYEPGKAALEMQQAMALAESLNLAKGLQEIQMAQTPIHTGQPSGGYNQDAVQEQMEFRLPGVMSDSLTAFQQEDNPRHFLPPDYRRTLRLKERTAPLTKELQLAGEIYASQEQLIEMAREAFGHIKLREAAEMSCTNDPAAGQGTRGDMIRVDKRAVPWASMDPNANLPQPGSGGEMKSPKPEKIKGLAYAKLRDNERAGPGSPHRSQTPGGAQDEQDEDQPQEKKKESPLGDQWKIQANDRRPQRNQGGGGGGDQQQQQSPLGMEQSQERSSSGSSGQERSGEQDQLAARQAGLAEQAAQLARKVANTMEPGDALASRATGDLREASREMRQAADSFQRGDVRAGIAQARQAQQAMRSGMHALRAAQAGSLDQALAAAQAGAATLVQNQYRVSQGTQQLEERIRELSGENPAQPGQSEPRAGPSEPRASASGTPTPARPGSGQPGKAQPGTSEPRASASGPATKGQPGTGQPGAGQPGEQQPGEQRPGVGQAGAGQVAGEKTQPGKSEPRASASGPATKGQPGRGQPGAGQPGEKQPGEQRPGEAQQTANPQSQIQNPKSKIQNPKSKIQNPSGAAVEKAKAYDPRLAANMQSLAGEQLKLSEQLKDFEGYVKDVVQWSKESEKDRVTTSLKDVSDGLEQDGVAQKMVDAGVDLSQQDVGAARATQDQIEAALEQMSGRLREAGDILAGSKTGIVGRAARQAKEIGEQVRQLAGLPQPGGQPGQGQPGQGQPGQGQPAQAALAQGQPGQGQPGQATPAQGQPGQGQRDQAQQSRAGDQPATGRPGQGQPGQGQPGQGQRSQEQAGTTQQSDIRNPKPDGSLAERLAADELRQAGASSVAGRPGPDTGMPGAGQPGPQVDSLWLKSRELTQTLRDEQLADPAALDYLARRVEDPTGKAFREMFEKVKKAEAGRFADVVTGIGKSLDEVLKETLSAKKLHSEQREESPPKFRPFIDAYFESLSKAATGKL